MQKYAVYRPEGGAASQASTACLLARKCHWLARKMAANMRNATCVRTETSKLPTYVALLYGSLFYGKRLFTTALFSAHAKFSRPNFSARKSPPKNRLPRRSCIPRFMYVTCLAKTDKNKQWNIKSITPALSRFSQISNPFCKSYFIIYIQRWCSNFFNIAQKHDGT